MDRRGFLQGVFGGVTSAGLILVAKPEEVAAFASPLVRDQPLVTNIPAPNETHIGQQLYNKHGELVAYVSSIDVTIPSVDVTLWGEATPAHVSGMPTCRIQAFGVGPIALDSRGIRIPVLRTR